MVQIAITVSGKKYKKFAPVGLQRFMMLVFLLLVMLLVGTSEASWDEWWTYEGISGVDFWGVLNPDWKLCKEGKRQSPVDINPSSLVFDPFLRPLLLDRSRVRGVLENNGHSIVFHLKERLDPAKEQQQLSKFPASSTSLVPSTHQLTSSSAPHSHSHSSHQQQQQQQLQTPNAQFVNISGGPLSYSYSFNSIHLHFGRSDGVGSEHTISGLSFPGELQILGYNSDLYRNMSDAAKRPHGLVAIAILIQLADTTSEELKVLTSNSHKIRFKGQQVPIPVLSIHSLITDPSNFVTYEGSMTIPGCFETATWIVINKPLLISRHEMYSLRKIMQGDSDLPKAPLGNNFRPTQPLNQRFLRTSIDFAKKMENQCPSMAVKRNYQVNSKHLNSGHNVV